MDEPRSCTVPVNGVRTDGKFLSFGDSIFYDDGGKALARTVAIVELPNGDVVEVQPSQVKFTDQND